MSTCIGTKPAFICLFTVKITSVCDKSGTEVQQLYQIDALMHIFQILTYRTCPYLAFSFQPAKIMISALLSIYMHKSLQLWGVSALPQST